MRGGEPDPAIRALEWTGDAVRILDQTRLPAEVRYVEARDPEAVAEAIRRMAIRGAPLIGIAAGYGLALAAVREAGTDARVLVGKLEAAGATLRSARPTAVNLGWAVDRVLATAREAALRGRDVPDAVAGEAHAIALEDAACCEAIGRAGAELVPDGANVLTHCNTGSLATGGIGTAQGVIVAAVRGGKRLHVWVDETRPLLQGARLTAWELERLGIPHTLLADTAAGSLMARALVDLVVVGADRIAANGDVANKVGTYHLAVLAARHRIPFYVAAPCSTVDLATERGTDIPIEERPPEEVTAPFGVPFAPPSTAAANPAFDVTPAELVTGIVTEAGVGRPPYGSSLRALVEAGPHASPGRVGAAARDSG